MGEDASRNYRDDLLHPVQVEIFRRMSFSERLRISQELTRTTWNRALAAFAHRYPDCTERQVLKKFVEFNYGKRLANEVYPDP